MAKIKGMLLALGTFLLVVPLLVISIIIHSTYLESEEKVIELGKIERLNELDKSIQDGFKAILNKEWGVNVSIDRDASTIIFNEGLKNPVRDIGELGLSTPFSNYESFVEGKYNTSPKINITDYVLDRIYNNLVIFVKPHMAVYKHDSTENEVTFIPEKQEHIAKCGEPCTKNGYKITLVVNEELISINAPSSCEGATCLRVEIEIWNTLGQLLGTYTMVVDPEASNTAIINFYKKDDAVEVKINKPAKLTLTEVDLSTDIHSFSINTTFSSVGYPYEHLLATLEENLINIYFEDMETLKKSTAVIS